MNLMLKPKPVREFEVCFVWWPNGLINDSASKIVKVMATSYSEARKIAKKEIRAQGGIRK